MTWHGSNVNEARALLQQQEGHGPAVSSRLGLIVYMPTSFSLSFTYARLPSHFIFPASVAQLFLHPHLSHSIPFCSSSLSCPTTCITAGFGAPQKVLLSFH